MKFLPFNPQQISFLLMSAEKKHRKLKNLLEFVWIRAEECAHCSVYPKVWQSVIIKKLQNATFLNQKEKKKVFLLYSETAWSSLPAQDMLKYWCDIFIYSIKKP